MEYYIYSYIDPITNLPFYIGKGSGDRLNRHLRTAKSDYWHLDSNKHKINKISKILSLGLEPVIRIEESQLSENESFEMERFYILKYGRSDIGTGILTNLSDGGEGQSGWDPPEEYRINMSKSVSGSKNGMFGKKQKEESKNKIREKATGRKFKPDVIEKMSFDRMGEKNNFFGKNHNKESREKMSKSHLGKFEGEKNPSAKLFLFISPNDQKFEVLGKFSTFCKENQLSEGRMKRFLDKGVIPGCKKNHNMTTGETINCCGWEVRRIK